MHPLIIAFAILILFACSWAIMAAPLAAPTTGQLFRAICMVESGNDPNAYNYEENAAGVAQIRPIMIQDANRIYRLRTWAKDGDHWTLNDRYDPAKSREIFETVISHYMTHYDLTGAKAAARIWNGGPTGWKKRATLQYWRKVSAALKGGA